MQRRCFGLLRFGARFDPQGFGSSEYVAVTTQESRACPVLSPIVLDGPSHQHAGLSGRRSPKQLAPESCEEDRVCATGEGGQATRAIERSPEKTAGDPPIVVVDESQVGLPGRCDEAVAMLDGPADHAQAIARLARWAAYEAVREGVSRSHCTRVSPLGLEPGGRLRDVQIQSRGSTDSHDFVSIEEADLSVRVPMYSEVTAQGGRSPQFCLESRAAVFGDEAADDSAVGDAGRPVEARPDLGIRNGLVEVAVEVDCDGAGHDSALPGSWRRFEYMSNFGESGLGVLTEV